VQDGNVRETHERLSGLPSEPIERSQVQRGDSPLGTVTATRTPDCIHGLVAERPQQVLSTSLVLAREVAAYFTHSWPNHHFEAELLKHSDTSIQR